MLTTELVPLSEAAQSLRLSWGQAWRLLLRGELEGEKRAGKWFVSSADVERLRRDSHDARTAARA